MSKAETQRVTVVLPVSLVEIVDKDRGKKTKRSTKIWDIVEQYYGAGEYEGQTALKDLKKEDPAKDKD